MLVEELEGGLWGDEAAAAYCLDMVATRSERMTGGGDVWRSR